MNKKHQHKTVQEMEAPVVKMDIDYSQVDTEPDKERPYGREYPQSRNRMPEKQQTKRRIRKGSPSSVRRAFSTKKPDATASGFFFY